MSGRIRALIASRSDLGERELAATLLAAIGIAGPVVGFATYLLPHPEGTDYVTPSIAFVVSIAASSLLWWKRRAAPWWAISLCLAIGTVVITIPMVAVPGRTGVYAGYYVLVAVFAAYFFSLRHAAAHLGWVGALYAGAIAIEQPVGGGEQWLNGVSIPAMVGLLIWALRMRIRSLLDELRSLADTDSLTELPNRRAFDQRLAAEAEAASVATRPLSLLLVDLDNFKQLNDSAGHHAGDVALQRVASVIAGTIRREDWAARYGGDEFAVLLPDSGIDEAELVAGRLATAVSVAFVGEEVELTASVGAASAEAEVDPVDLTAAADRALYRAKPSRPREEHAEASGGQGHGAAPRREPRHADEP